MMETCCWCGKPRRKWSGWEQQNIRTKKYHQLCSTCANKRLRNPLNALLPMRRVVDPELDSSS